jgi:hypothetical protein
MELKLIKFYHEADIKIITGELPLLLDKDLGKEHKLTDHFKINELSKPYKTVSNGNELNILEYEIVYSGKKVPLTFSESVVSAEMTINIDNKPVGSIKKMEERSPELIVAISHAVLKSIKGKR